jgi:tyrosine-protein kinase Etk/Wzc
MPEENTLSQKMQGKLSTNGEMLKIKKIFSLIVTNRYYFIVALVVSLTVAYLYNTYTIPVFKVSATVLIEENRETSSSGNDQLLEGFGLMPGMKNFDNQLMVLSSRALISKALDELMLDIEFYNKGLLNKKSLYPVQPVTILKDKGSNLPEEVVFAIKFLDNGTFHIKTESRGAFKIDKVTSFGEQIDYPGCSFRIEMNDSGWLADKNREKLYFTLHSRRNLVESYVKRLKIDRASKQGSIVKISLDGTNKTEDLAFLNKLSEIFVNISLNRKNNEAVRTIQFIDDQLAGISDSLLITENKLQQFRSRNKVMNLSAQGQVIIDQAMNLENQKARLGIEAGYYDYLKTYLEKDSAGEVPIAPATIGITDPGLTKLVADLAEQQGKLYSKSMGEKNPLQSQISQKVTSTKEALKETLKGLSSANNLAIQENLEQIKSVNEKATVLPRTERQLLGIERKYKLNDELYTFLLEKRAVAQMQKASNVADNEIIDYPEYDNKPVKPKKPLIYLIALMTGIGFPFLWIFLADIFNLRIREMEEILEITNVPIIGQIPKNAQKDYSLVLKEPGSQVAEAFRLLRSRMMFFTKDSKKPVILITSSMPEEGKTFTAINLASAYSLLGKRTVLVGFDLRQPKIFSDFALKNDHGISTWLIGKDNLDKIINQTGYENLHIITSGPVPPNPAELTSLEKTRELFILLKERYECIIVDSSPVGTVSDTYHLASLADTCILVVRQKLTYKDHFANTINDLKISGIKSLSIVFNGVLNSSKNYGYGEKSKYTSSSNHSKLDQKNVIKIPLNKQ